MKVYRVETEAGLGPYRFIRGGYNPDTDRIQPTPEEDGWNWSQIDDFEKYHLFGFASMKQFHNWFDQSDYFVVTHQIPLLLQLRFGITEYDIDEEHVQKGKHQVVFDKRKAWKVKHEKLANILSKEVRK